MIKDIHQIVLNKYRYLNKDVRGKPVSFDYENLTMITFKATTAFFFCFVAEAPKGSGADPRRRCSTPTGTSLSSRPSCVPGILLLACATPRPCPLPRGPSAGRGDRRSGAGGDTAQLQPHGLRTAAPLRTWPQPPVLHRPSVHPVYTPAL